MPIIGQISVGDGATFTPSVNSAGELSWTNNKNLPNPATVDIAQAVIDSGAGIFLPLTGGTVTGSVEVTGGITANVTGNADTATNATNDSNGNQIDTTYLPLSGGTLTGDIKGNPLILTADDGNNTSSLVLGADGSLALDGKSLSNVPDMSVFADGNFTAPTVYSGRATSVNGGYKKIGNIVYVLLSFLPNNLNTVGRWTMFQGFPPAYNDTPMPFFADLGDNINSTKVSWINITTGGYLYMAINSAISNDTDPSHKIRIQGYYLAAQ